MAKRAMSRRRASVFALAVVAAGTLLGTPAWAGETDATAALPDGVRVVEVDGTTLYASERDLTSVELEELAALQTEGQIATTISLASSDQPIQLLDDYSRPSGSYSAAVLLDPQPEPADVISARSTCTAGPSAGAISYHYVGSRSALYGYCNSGSNNVSHGNFFKIKNQSSYAITYVSTTTGGRSCSANATCSVPSAYQPTTLTNVSL